MLGAAVIAILWPRNDWEYYNHERGHTGCTTAGRCPADLVYGARKMEPR